jgi:uncharacterized protein (TIGR03067 family)
MPLPRFTFFAVIIAAANSYAQERSPDSDLNHLQGTWQCVSSHFGFKADAVKEDYLLVIKADRISDSDAQYAMRWIGSTTDDCYYMKFRLDPTKRPKHITLEIWVATVDHESGTVIKEAPEGTELQGVYEIADGKLGLCIAPADGKRPTSFALQDGYSNEVFERKPEDGEGKESR